MLDSNINLSTSDTLTRTTEISRMEHRSNRRRPVRQKQTLRVPTPNGPHKTITVRTTYEGQALRQPTEHHPMHETTRTSRPQRCHHKNHILRLRNTLVLDYVRFNVFVSHPVYDYIWRDAKSYTKDCKTVHLLHFKK